MLGRRYLSLFLAFFLWPIAELPAQSPAHLKAVRSSALVLIPRSKDDVGIGTAWVVDESKKLLITNHHVVGGVKEVKIHLPRFEHDDVQTAVAAYQDAKPLVGKVVLVDSKKDLALIHVAELPAGVPALPLAAIGATVGQKVYSVGNSTLNQGELWKFREGTVKGRGFKVWSLSNTGGWVESRMLEHEPAIAPGDSGGPLVDEDGKLVAVISSFEPETSRSIDVAEVRLLLVRHAQGGLMIAAASPLEGHWTFSFKNAEGQDVFMGLVLYGTGKGLWYTPSGRHVMTYTVSDLDLHLVCPGLNINEAVRLTWRDPNTFLFTSASLEFTAKRR